MRHCVRRHGHIGHRVGVDWNRRGFVLRRQSLSGCLSPVVLARRRPPAPQARRVVRDSEDSSLSHGE